MNAEHLHLAINHLSFLGSAFALLPILVGLILKHRITLLTGLAMAAFSGWTTPLVMETGEQAYERYEDGPVASYLDADAEAALETHEHRAEDWSVVLYASAVVASLAFVVALWSDRAGRIAGSISALLCLAALAAGIWIALSGGEIRRPDFRAESGVNTRD